MHMLTHSLIKLDWISDSGDNASQCKISFIQTTRIKCHIVCVLCIDINMDINMDTNVIDGHMLGGLNTCNIVWIHVTYDTKCIFMPCKYRWTMFSLSIQEYCSLQYLWSKKNGIYFKVGIHVKIRRLNVDTHGYHVEVIIRIQHNYRLM